MSAITVFRTFVAATLCTALAACAMGPDFVRPQAELPGHWRGGAVAGNAIDQDAAWWAGFDDPLLGQLAHQVLAANLDLQLAANRVQQSRTARGITAADRLPSVSASASGVRARNSEVGLNDPSGNGGRDDYGLFQAGIGLGWELDLWGRVRRQVEAADARVQMAEEDAHAVRIALLAETARDLLAQPPQALDAQLQDARRDWPALPAVAVGLPSELAERRPDIRRAEAALHAATAGIGVAKASFLPRITLNGDAGFQAKQLDDLDGWNAHRFSIGPSISLPIFQGGRLKANLALSRLQQQQSALQFRRTVLQAWHEVDDAMDGYSAEQQRTVQLHVAVDESETALGAARRQYQAGVVDMLDVLTTQRIALDNQAALANSQAAAAIARVELYRALGGGW
ncbi:TolC family protein [Stenotrophomonas maltophilia]|uniref:TolC family protein n=1 Tax=unclassified Stenotrophomonas TaxID=196198 RepID=UPI0018D4B6E8|nr:MULTISPECIES: TolC family protein [unclassified Stenotrophomonas]MBH1738808.1 TolC family protein [Stenotrophomonas maltophilia]WNB81184.1 TolC family protein [Stenotrophomonas sp. 9]